jgi:GDPmannose 4,6-dehydratase
MAAGAAAIKLGVAERAVGWQPRCRARDWSYAKDYAEAIWLMLQEDEQDDCVIATGEAHSVRQLVEVAFAHVSLDPDDHVRTNPRFRSPAEVEHLVGDASKAGEKLGWEPRTTFEQMVRVMVDVDLELVASGAPKQQAG